MPLVGSSSIEWDNHAEEFAKFPTKGPMSLPVIKLISAMNAAFPFASATSIVDIGCGSGAAIGTLIDNHGDEIPPSTHLIASDFSMGMIDIIRQRKREQKENPLWQRVEPIIYDATDLHGLADRSVSHIVGNMVYFMLPNPDKGFTEAYRVLRSDGVFGLTSFARNDWMDIFQAAARRVRPDCPIAYDLKDFGNLATADGLRQELDTIGFKQIEIEEVEIKLPQESIAMFGRGFIQSSNPAVVAIFAGFTQEERTRASEEWMKIAEGRENQISSISLVVCATK